MDLHKAKIYLDKINREFARMSKDPDNIARIDVDIMMAYVRELYDAFLTEKTATPAAKTEPQRPEPVKMADHHREQPVAKPAPPPAKMVVREEPSAPQAPMVEVEPPRPAAPAPVQPIEPAAPIHEPVRVHAKPLVTEPVMPREPEPPQPKPAAPAAPPPVFSEKFTPEAESLFEQKQARELSEKLADRPIEDLKKGIALNDRLLFTAELFGKDNHAFDHALTTLNTFSIFEQAKYWLIENCVSRFDWTHKNRTERAKEFIRLVRRRYK